MGRTSDALTIDGRLLDRFSGVVGGIYDAAINPEQWPSVVKTIADLHDCPQALLLTPGTAPRDGGFVFPHGISESTLQLWSTKYVHHDPWVRAALEKDLYHDGNVLFSEDLLPRSDLEGTLFYREFLVPLDMYHFATGVVFGAQSTGAVPTNCSLLNRRAAPPFTEINRKLHGLTVTHLSRALGTMFRLRDAELRLASNIAALDRLNAGVVLFGARGNVVFANLAAMEMLRAEDGLRLRAGNPLEDGMGWIGTSRTLHETALQGEIATAIAFEPLSATHFACGVQIKRPSGKRSYLVQLSSLAPNNEFSLRERQALAIGFISDPDATPRLDAKVLTQTFALTVAEAELAQELLCGDPIKEVARRLMVSENTVKTQLHSIFKKTQTDRQAQLVKLLMSLASTRV